MDGINLANAFSPGRDYYNQFLLFIIFGEDKEYHVMICTFCQMDRGQREHLHSRDLNAQPIYDLVINIGFCNYANFIKNYKLKKP